ncbi:hypothetical protein QVD17_33118 [Tagetes erecta]|uniref:Uncharacterized protein n=1 Tax=Tagetes erecta TaxID=13708 RepID=A0AAD8JY37_TARER|nr:hypothetical protein QVD17_33118 [Tagetes erecta]
MGTSLVFRSYNPNTAGLIRSDRHKLGIQAGLVTATYGGVTLRKANCAKVCERLVDPDQLVATEIQVEELADREDELVYPNGRVGAAAASSTRVSCYAVACSHQGDDPEYVNLGRAHGGLSGYAPMHGSPTT